MSCRAPRIIPSFRPLLVAVTSCSLIVAAPGALAQDKGVPGTLVWRNGDELPGALVGADGNRLIWKSEVFAQPMPLDVGVLTMVRGAKPAAAPAIGPFRLTLANGNRLDGDLVGVSETEIRVRSQRFGQLALLRSSVSGITRVDRSDLVDLVRSGGERWQLLNAHLPPVYAVRFA